MSYIYEEREMMLYIYNKERELVEVIKNILTLAHAEAEFFIWCTHNK